MNSVQRGKSPRVDRVQQVPTVAFAIIGDHRCGLGIGEVGDALLRTEMELHPHALVRRVDHREGVAAEQVHVAEAFRDAAVGHHDGHLVQRLGQQGPEVPVVVGAAQAGARVALDRVIEVGEAQRIAEEEHRRVVADDVPVAFLGVELQRGAADVALRIRRAALAGDGGEAHEHRRLLADGAEDLRPGEAGDVVRHGEGAVGAPAFRVHPPLRDHLAVEMRQLLDQPDILQQRRAARTCGHDVGVVGNRQRRSRW